MEPTRPLRFALINLAYAMLLAGDDRAQAQAGSWTDPAELNIPRRLLAAAATEDEKLYAFGGCGSPCFGPFHPSAEEETTVEVYLPQTRKWMKLEKRMPTILFGAAAALPGNGKIYTFGGYVSGNVVQEYDPENDSWKIKRPMPTARYGLAAVALGGKIYVLGGSGPSAALEIYDPAKDTWTPGAPMPTPRVFLAAVALDDKIHAIGGSPDCCGKSQTDAVEIYDPAKDRWDTGPRLPSARQVSAAVSMNEKIYLFGGFIPGSGVQADTLVYDPRSRMWTFGTPLPVAKDQAPAVLIGSRVFIPGGSVDCHCRALARTDVFELPSLTCTKDRKGPASVAAGEIVTYTIRVENPGAVAVAGVTLIDPPTEGLVPDGEPSCSIGKPCALGTLAPGASRSVELRFQVTGTGSCDSRNEITNVAKVSAPGLEDLECPAEPISALGGQACLGCIKTGPSSTRAGEPFTYSVAVINSGSKAVRNVMLSDPPPAGLEFIEASCGTLPGKLGTLEPGESRVVTLSFQAVCSDRASVVNVARVSGKGAPADECSMETLLVAEADLGIEVNAPVSVAGEAKFNLPVKITNPGPAMARKATMTLDLQGASLVTVPPGCPSDSRGPGPFTCMLGDVACGEERTLTFQLQAPPCADCNQPPITVNASVISETDDPNPLNNSDSDGTQVEYPCLEVEKTDDPDPVAPGGKLSYTITVENAGSLDAPGVTVKDITPPELTGVQWCQEGKDCPPAPRGPLAAEIDLPAGASKVFRLNGVVPPACGPLTNTVSAEHPLAGKAEDVEETRVAGLSLLCQGIDGTFLEGSVVTYTFVLVNCGPAGQMDNPGDEFTNTLPAGLTLVSASATSGMAATNLNTATWNGAVAVGETVTITVQATIGPGTAGTTICNQAAGSFDLDGNGNNETVLLSDDPHMPGGPDPCCFTVVDVLPDGLPIPTVSDLAAVALALLLAALSLRRLRRPSAGR